VFSENALKITETNVASGKRMLNYPWKPQHESKAFQKNNEKKEKRGGKWKRGREICNSG